MRNRYQSNNTSNSHLRQPSPKSRENINIQIFNISSRNRKQMHSAIKNSSQLLDESLNLNLQQGMIKRGRSVFNRSKQNPDKQSSNRPIVPSSEHIKKISSKKLQVQRELESEKESFNRETASQEEIGFEELHFKKVRYLQKCKKLIQC